MPITEALQEQLDRLNPQQREAVDHVDGPLLVIAGPGTGKTQLLSLRAANILATRDVAPRNILCLTYTEAGARAMRKRLVELIGRDAYGLEVCTFHGFCAQLRSRYPEYFHAGVTGELVSGIRQGEILNGLLKELPASSPLYAGVWEGVQANFKSIKSFVSEFKKSGLALDEFRAMQQQTLQFIELAKQSPVLDMIRGGMPGDHAAKEEFDRDFREAVEELVASAPRELREPVITTPGIYVPYATWLRGLVRRTEFFDEDFKTEGFKKFRDEVFVGNRVATKKFRAENDCKRALAAIDIYEKYQAQLAEEGLYDFDDMIGDALDALNDDGLRGAMQQRYQYIQVDEFQDTNGAQLRLVELLTNGGDPREANVMAVGDDDQAIMRFQGASVECIRQFQERCHPHEVVLRVNYRSTPAIVELGGEVGGQIERRIVGGDGDAKRLTAYRAESEQTEFTARVFASQDVERYELARDIRKRIDAGFIGNCEDPSEAIAVISPKNRALADLIPYLHRFDVPFTYRVTSEISQMECMQTLIAVMRFVVARSLGHTKAAEAQLPQIVASPELGISHSSCIWLAREVRSNEEYCKSWITALRKQESGRLAELWSWLDELAAEQSAAPVRGLIARMARRIGGYYEKRKDENVLAFAEFNAGIRALLDFAEGELCSGRGLGRAMRLSDVMERFELAQLYDEKVNATVELGTPGAATLTTAHGSKGLEFDLVYLLDADDGTWRKESNGMSCFPQNMLVGDGRGTADKVDDEDDVHRLLFVAVTRAKRFLEVYRGPGELVRELQGLVEEEEVEAAPEDLDDIIATSWARAFELDTPELVKLLEPLAPEHLSVSALNDFVAYEPGCPNSLEFPAKRMLCLPQEPSIALEFGRAVHEFMKDYVAHVLAAGDTGLDGLAEATRQKILRMDFEEKDVQSYAGRFDRIVGQFVPRLGEALASRLDDGASVRTEMKLNAHVASSEVPLFGICDLIVLDEARHEAHIVDYKTGFNYKHKNAAAYRRQLQFYKLLLENSVELPGYRVVDEMDIYIEPEKGSEGDLHEPVREVVSSDDLEHLTKLVEAVWARIQAGAYDTSAFEESELYKSKVAGKSLQKGRIQSYYEQWLIDTPVG